MERAEMTDSVSSTHTLILVAKFPRIGKCKTRLATETSVDFAQKFAKACIGDLVDKFGKDFLQENSAAKLERGIATNDKVRRVILFAPATDKEEYRKWLDSECPETSPKWLLLPMKEPTENDAAVGVLGAALGGSIVDVSCRKSSQNGFGSHFGSVAFIGMDTPHIPTEAVAESFAYCCTNKGNDDANATFQPTAYICPAQDGGYVLLTLPPAVANENNAYRVFENVAWSTAEACKTQVKAIGNLNFRVKYGPVYSDVDELKDLDELKAKLASDDTIDCPRLRKLLLESRENYISDE